MKRSIKIISNCIALLTLTSCNFSKIIGDFGNIFNNTGKDDGTISSKYLPENLEMTVSVYDRQTTCWKNGLSYSCITLNDHYITFNPKDDYWEGVYHVNGKDNVVEKKFSEVDVLEATFLSSVLSYLTGRISERYTLEKTKEKKTIADKECTRYSVKENDYGYTDFYLSKEKYLFETVADGGTVFKVISWDTTITKLFE
ncbi:MAG: hypothetical protein MJ238_07200 [Bacilli bacterium]|nr:hypothetical protein [Bacilli bacterium]